MIIDIFSFQNELNQPSCSTAFYFNIKIVEDSQEMEEHFLTFGHFFWSVRFLAYIQSTQFY